MLWMNVIRKRNHVRKPELVPQDWQHLFGDSVREFVFLPRSCFALQCTGKRTRFLLRLNCSFINCFGVAN